MINCWMCSGDTGVEEGQYGDFTCNNCGVMISVPDPNIKPLDPKPLTTQEEYLLTREQKEEIDMDLKNWSKDNAKFIKIKSGESYEGVYKGCKSGVNMNGEPAVVYNLDGKEFKSSSTVLADRFALIPEGTKIRLSRAGEGLQTKWSVETL